MGPLQKEGTVPIVLYERLSYDVEENIQDHMRIAEDSSPGAIKFVLKESEIWFGHLI